MNDLETVLIQWHDEAVAQCLPALSASDLDWLSGRIATVDDLLAYLRTGRRPNVSDQIGPGRVIPAAGST